MEEECLKSESDFLPPNECGRSVDGGVDRISQLPDDILLVILSFLRLREAATTSVLSSRWSDLWKHTPYLEFDKHIPHYDYPDDSDLYEAERCKYIETVNAVIQSHKALSLKKFTISLHVKKSDQCAVTKWLKFVLTRQVERLELMFTEGDHRLVLEELLRESRMSLQPQTDLIFFHSLKTLFLGCLILSGEGIELFLRNCPLLEQLTICGGTLTSDVELCGANLALKHLGVAYCNGGKSIKVSAPNLTYVTFMAFSAAVREVKLLLENVPKLVEADFRLHTPENVVQHFASLVSCHFSQLQILNLELSSSKCLFQLLDILASGFRFRMPNLKKLVIICDETYNHNFLPVTALIWEFPRLEEFILMYCDSFEEEPASTQVITDVGRSPHQHLKVFELQMSPRQNVNDHIAELVMHISNNCVALRKIIIDRCSTLVDPAIRDNLAQLLQGNVPNHIQVELFNDRL